MNATEQTDGMGLQCKYETEGRARLKKEEGGGGFLGPEDQSVSVCVREWVRERERERERESEWGRVSIPSELQYP